VIVNDDFEHALGDLRRILADAGEELKSHRPELKPLLAELLASP
jgi:hypothetical protein